MNATLRMDGTKRITVRVDFHVTLDTLVTSAMGILDFVDGETLDTLTKKKIMDRLRSELWSDGDIYSEFGREKLIKSTPIALVTERVLELFPDFR